MTLGNHETFDLVILGSGLGGSLAAMVARQRGLSVAICDPTPHPRFVIGESSTPTASLLVEAIADEFDLPEIAFLSSHARWTAEHPEIMRGRKRGFVYVGDIQPLAFAASSEANADTHWMRSDTDRFLLAAAVRRGARLIAANPIAERYHEGQWRFVFERREPIRSKLLLVTNAVPPHLDGVEAIDPPFRYRSRIAYTHAASLPPTTRQAGWPFPPDESAMHAIGPDGWGWALRFDDGRVSVGYEQTEFEGDDVEDALRRTWPDFALADPPGRILTLATPQRCCDVAGGEALALLPHAFGFVTPLHSTGLMSTIAAAPLAVDALMSETTDELTPRYRDLLTVVDRLAVLADRTRGWSRGYEAAVSHYIAAAIGGERGRFDRTRPLLRSDEPAFHWQLDEAIERADRLNQAATDAEANASADTADQLRAAEAELFDWSREQLAQFCDVALCDPAAGRMYSGTAAR